MNTWVEALHYFLRGSHIVTGFVGLALFWLVIFLKKGTPRHRWVGKCFAYAAFYVGGTAMISSTWALLHVESFVPQIVEYSGQAQEKMRGQYRFLFSILLFLAVATISGAVYGLQSMRYKENVAALWKTSLPYWMALSALVALGLALFGAYHLFSTVSDGGISRAAYWIPLLLGAFGIAETNREMRRVYRPLQDPREWLYRHVEQMLGTGIAFHTAFLVFGGSRLFGNNLTGPLVILPWITPIIVGTIGTKWYISRLKRLHDTPSSRSMPSVPADRST